MHPTCCCLVPDRAVAGVQEKCAKPFLNELGYKPEHIVQF